jgi:hypothetical protein
MPQRGQGERRHGKGEVGALTMSNKRYTFPAPIFTSRVLRARLLAKLSGKRFVWDERERKFVLKKGPAAQNAATGFVMFV